jgi:hypothetical protein
MLDKFSEKTRLPKPVALVFESNSSYLGKEVYFVFLFNPLVALCPDVPNFIILLCLMPDDF